MPVVCGGEGFKDISRQKKCLRGTILHSDIPADSTVIRVCLRWGQKGTEQQTALRLKVLIKRNLVEDDHV